MESSLRTNQHLWRILFQQKNRSMTDVHLTQLQSHQRSIQKRCWCPSSRSSQRRKRFSLPLLRVIIPTKSELGRLAICAPLCSQRQASGYSDDTNSCPSLALKILPIPSPIPRLSEHLSPYGLCLPVTPFY